MRSAFAFAVLAPLLLAGASAAVVSTVPGSGNDQQRAAAEVKAASAALQRLEAATARARGAAAKLAAEREAAAAAIAESEARITLAEARLAVARQALQRQRQKLAEQQAPASALVAGLVTIGRRPPILGLADSSSLDEMVRVRALLDTALPVVRARSAALAGELERGDRLVAAAAAARDRLHSERTALGRRRDRLAALEDRAAADAARLAAGSVGAGDTVIASSERSALALSRSEQRRAEGRLAAALAALPPAPARPGTRPPPAPPIAYRLPVAAPVVEGVGSLSRNGVRSRGLLLDAQRGDAVRAPAAGRIAFAGPYRRHDGVLIIDHGQGWMSLLSGVATQRRQGERLAQDEPMGRALGPVRVELSINGVPVSAALIAGSSQLLSNRRKGG